MRIVAFAFLAGCSFRSPSAGAGDAPAPGDGQALDGAPLDAQISFIIQAEDATRTGVPAGTAWMVATAPSGFTGAGVMTLQPDAPAVCVDPLTELCASLEFDVMIAEARPYHVFARMYASNGAEDSLLYALGDEGATIVDTNENQPAWRWGGNLVRSLAPGLHTLRIWSRESTLHLDAVALMPSNVPPP